MNFVYIGRQPILDSNANLFAYDIVYRNAEDEVEANVSSNRYASASVINRILNIFGTDSIPGKQKAFIKIDEKFLLNDLIFSIPKELFIFALLESVSMSEYVVERVQQLYAKGYTLALNDISLTKDRMETYRSIFKELSYVKLNLNFPALSVYKELIQEFNNNSIDIVGTKIETAKEYRQAREIGCECFQGYYFAEPKILEHAKYAPSQMEIIEIYNLLMQDTNIDEITTKFETCPALTLQLLQFINSGAFHFKNKISSIHHILTLVGRKPLAQWLMLMIYSKSITKSKPSPLMLMVSYRTQLMQDILKKIEPNVGSNRLGEAYFVGVLSLLDTAFGIELQRILKDLNISEEVEKALLEEKGLLGEIYKLTKDIEAFNVEKIEAFIIKYNIDAKEMDSLINLPPQ